MHRPRLQWWMLVWLPPLVLGGGCPPPEDGLEPNDSPAEATPLTPGVPIEARVIQDDPDVFTVPAGPGQEITFRLDALSGEDCIDFRVTGPDAAVLYADGQTGCGRVGPPEIQVEGAELAFLPDFGGYELTVPAELEGTYVLTIRELSYADNIFDNSLDYRVTATVE